jgi:hypothetical protein
MSCKKPRINSRSLPVAQPVKSVYFKTKLNSRPASGLRQKEITIARRGHKPVIFHLAIVSSINRPILSFTFLK